MVDFEQAAQRSDVQLQRLGGSDESSPFRGRHDAHLQVKKMGEVGQSCLKHEALKH